MSESPSHWYAVHTHPRAEEKAAAHLRRQGFKIYLPRYLKRRRHARRIETVPSALFPRYLFIAIDLEAQRWRAVQSTIGVVHLVCNGCTPAAVDNRVIDELKQHENEQGFIHLDQRPRYRPGEKVHVLDGLFAARFGFFEGVTDNERVTILLELLGRKVRVVLDAESVAAA